MQRGGDAKLALLFPGALRPLLAVVAAAALAPWKLNRTLTKLVGLDLVVSVRASRCHLRVGGHEEALDRKTP